MNCPKCSDGKLKANGHTPGGKQRHLCTSCGYSTTDPSGAARTQSGKRSQKTPVFKRTLGKVERFIVTAAQNATPVHKPFVQTVEIACNDLNAEPLCIPLRYKNPTSRWSSSQANDEFWADEVRPYLWNTRKALGKNLLVMGDIKIQPTASSPLNAMEAITHGESGIFGHTKLQLRSVPTLPGKLPKLLTTTGACTVPNYTDSRAGKLGEFHQTLGAVLVEVRGKRFHIRQLNASKRSGEFVDLDKHFSTAGVRKAGRCKALIMGDTHVDAVCPDVVRATFGAGGMTEVLRPEVLVWHDLLDGNSINPHHRGNPFVAVAKRFAQMDEARAEVERALAFVEKYTKGCKSVIVASNHDDFLQRWLSSCDWRTDPTNAEFYLETALAMVRAAKSGSEAERLSAFGYWAQQHFGKRDDVKVLKPDESFTVADIELSMHFDRGPNGSRGSIKNMRRIGTKTIGGHSHSPGIDEGAVQVGTSTKLRLGYTVGPSSWLNVHATIDELGKRQLHFIIDGEWRL